MFVTGRKRRAYSPEFKNEAVKLVVNTGRSVATVAGEVGVPPQTLARWVNAYRDQVGEATPLSETERAELKRLRREVRELELDRACQKSVLRINPIRANLERGPTSGYASGAIGRADNRGLKRDTR